MRQVVALEGTGALEFLDVGASDGITTLEAVRMFEQRLNAPVHACLIDPFIRLLRYRSGSIVEYRTPDQSPVMVRVGAIGLQLSSLDTSRDVLSRVLGQWYLSRASAREAMQVDATISLVNPLVAADPSVSVLEWDVLRHNPALVARFHAVRASNVLNHSYFSASQIDTALSHLHEYLVEGGLLLISRSRVAGEGEIDHGSIWRKAADRLVHQHSFGDGVRNCGAGESIPRRRDPSGVNRRHGLISRGRASVSVWRRPYTRPRRSLARFPRT